MGKKYNLLIVDDEEPLRVLLESELSESEEFSVDCAADGGEAINKIQAKVYDVILLDIRMPRVTGIEVLKFVQEYSPTTQVIILTNYADVKTAIQTIKMGAYDFLAKPYDIDELFNTIHRAIERKQLFIDNKLMKSELTRKAGNSELIGQAPVFLKLIESATRFAESDSFVLVQGASGTGKELIASLIHRRRANRQARPAQKRHAQVHPAQGAATQAMSGGVAPFLTIAEAGRLIAAKRLSPVELTRSLLARIAELDPKLNAYLLVTERQALAEARAAERAVMTGRKGPLLGIPLAYKDIYETAGVRTTAHSRILVNKVPTENAETVRRLHAQGAVMLGKLATHEFAIGGPAFDLPWPPARNPWDPRRYTGGSSSGSAAAVAAGLALGALGSDTGGSIRLPASYCGIAGIKPTPGLVSRRGVIPLAPSLDTAGPMAWTAEDCAILLDALAGYDPADPASVAGPPVSYAQSIAAPLRGLRIGVLRRFYEHDVPASPEMLQSMTRAVSTLRSLGCRVEDAILPPVQDYNAVGRVIISAEAYSLHETTLKTRLSDYSRVFRVRVLGGALIRAADYIAAQRRRTDLIATTAQAFERFDVLITAPTAGAAPLLAEQRPDDGFARPLLTTVANVAALPSMVVCGGRTAAGLPLGLEIIGPAWGDATILRVGHQFEQATRTRDTRPEL